MLTPFPARRSLSRGVLWTVFMAISLPVFSAAQPLRRVRDAGDPEIAQLIAEGARRSATFRALVEAIDATDGLVYVQPGECLHGVRACLVLSIQVAGPFRILRILVSTRRDRLELIAAIGHELHHAADVLGNSKVRTMEQMFYHFLRGQTPGVAGRFETPEAIKAGLEIENELRAR